MNYMYNMPQRYQKNSLKIVVEFQWSHFTNPFKKINLSINLSYTENSYQHILRVFIMLFLFNNISN